MMYTPVDPVSGMSGITLLTMPAMNDRPGVGKPNAVANLLVTTTYNHKM